MHDIDSTRLEFSPEYEYQEQEADFEAYEGSFEMPMNEAEEEALVAELLGVSDEAEMDQFLGGLFKKITKKLGGAAGQLLARHAGPLAGALKKIAGKNLPFLGGVLGTAIPIPGLGTALGSVVGNAASRLLQKEMGEMEAEEQEYEITRRFVRLATNAIRRVAGGRIPANPLAAATVALRNAVRDLSRPYAIQPVYRPCPPCPVCPTCSQPTPAPAPDMPTPPPGGGDMTGGGDTSGPEQPAPTNVTPQNPEFEFPFGQGEFSGETNGEYQGEGEYYETNYEAPVVPSEAGSRSGRWVRRGRKIVIYGL